MRIKHLIILFIFTSLNLHSYENLMDPSLLLKHQFELTERSNKESIILPRELGDKEKLFEIISPLTLVSYNSEFFHGSMDSGLWQGKGFNGYISAGVALNLPYLTVVLAPEFYYSQNLEFETFNEDYTNPNQYLDNPERMGDISITDFHWGQSSVSLSYKYLSIGFGTENFWVGPSKYNPALFSNNAEGFPKLDFRLRPLNTPLGTFESYLFYGQLDKSDIDTGSDYDKTFLNGLTISYIPAIWKNFNVSATRVVSAKWDTLNANDFLTMINMDMQGGDNDFGQDIRDQRISLSFDIRYPEIGFRVYTDIGRNDFSPNMRYLLRYIRHTVTYTSGFEQIITLNDNFSILLESEISDFILSEDYEVDLGRHDGSSFYAHGLLDNGFTNNGQILGNGMSSGSDSLYLGISLFYRELLCKISYQRIGNNFDYVLNHFKVREGVKVSNVYSMFDLSATLPYKDFYISANIKPIWELNDNFIERNDKFNLYSSLSISYNF